MSNYLKYIPQEWIETHGLGVNVGFCETGFNLSNPKITQQVKEYKTFGDISCNHGNHVVSIVCDETPRTNNVGMTYKSNLLIGATNLSKEDSKENFLSVLSWLKTQKLDVLNLSLAFDEDNEKVRLLLEEISEETIIVCSYSAKHFYPNSYPFVVSVGYNNYDGAKLIAPRSVMSLGVGDFYSKFSGTSASCAVASQVFCLAKAYDKKITKEEVLKIISGGSLLDFSEKALSVKRRTQRILE